MAEELQSYSQVATELGVDVHTISDLVRKRGLKQHRSPTNKLGIYLDRDTVEGLRRVIEGSELANTGGKRK